MERHGEPGTSKGWPSTTYRRVPTDEYRKGDWIFLLIPGYWKGDLAQEMEELL